MGWKGRERGIKKGERERKEGKKEKDESTSPGASVDPAEGVTRVLGLQCARDLWGYLFIDKFPHPGDKFLVSYANYLAENLRITEVGKDF